MLFRQGTGMLKRLNNSHTAFPQEFTSSPDYTCQVQSCALLIDFERKENGLSAIPRRQTLVWHNSLWITLAAVLAGQQEKPVEGILQRSGVLDPWAQRWINEGTSFGFPLTVSASEDPVKSCPKQIPFIPTEGQGLLAAVQDSKHKDTILVCNQTRTKAKSWWVLNSVHNSAHLKQGSRREASACPSCPQLQPGQSGRGRCWSAPTQPAQQPELLRLATSSKQQQTTPCSAAWATHRGSRARRELRYSPVPSELAPTTAFSQHYPSLWSSRLCLKVQSVPSLNFHSYFQLECLLFPFKKTAASLRYKGQKALLAKPGSQQ